MAPSLALGKLVFYYIRVMWSRIKEGLSNYNPDSSKDPVVKDTVSISMIQTVYLGVEMPKNGLLTGE